MIKSEFKNLITDIENACKSVKPGELMKNHTTFKIGGPCIALAEPENSDELRAVIGVCKNYSIPYFVLGRGSNLLVSDNGYRGVMIKPGKSFQEICFDEETNTITAGCGVTLAALAAFACERGIAGFEFASGIPGTVGGGVRMNAGAYGGEMSQIVTDCTYLKGGEVYNVNVSELDFSYRHSMFSDMQDYVILSATFKGTGNDTSENIRKTMTELNLKRKEKQPLEFASAGSTFKRPEGTFVGKLMDDLGLKGFAKGDAAVSEKHGGFVVNKGNASCEDILFVMSYVRNKVYEIYNVVLEPEVILLGDISLKEVSLK
jgi:UDP-N-acetylmuramate dehydrogenase